MGENKIVFKDYTKDQDAQGESQHILTVLDSIFHIIIPNKHKLLVVFDNQLDVLVYYTLGS
jgi:hypothetical protein